ncbi:MAG: ABC transporter ATP-binding protein [Halanaeroarchaeum sp.]
MTGPRDATTESSKELNSSDGTNNSATDNGVTEGARGSTIELHGITKEYEELTAVKNLDLTVEKGELLSFLGPSGSGKTTTLNIIAGLESPTEGNVIIDGERVNDVPPQERDIAMVFQSLGLFERMTVRENLGFPRKMAGASSAEIADTVETIAETIGFSKAILDRNVGDLTPSMRQQVALGRAIAAEPSILLLDEPMNNLDREEALEMRGEFKTLQEEFGQTMIYVTHDQEEAMSLSDRIMVMREGELQQVGTPEALYERPRNKFVAGFIGSPSMNFLTGTLEEGGVSLLGRTIPDQVLREHVNGYDPERFPGTVTIGVRPESLEYEPGECDVRFEVTVTGKEPLGSETIVYTQTDQGEVTLVTQKRPRVQQEGPVSIGGNYADLYLIDPETEEVVY